MPSRVEKELCAVPSKMCRARYSLAGLGAARLVK